MVKDELEKALDAVDEALADAPKRNGEAFSKALENLSRARKTLFAREGRDSENSRRRLDRLNGCISIVLAGHFPLGEAPWDEIRKMRGWLEELVREVAE